MIYSRTYMKPNLTQLKNGLRIVTVPMAENETATVMVLVEAGSKYEEKSQNGISHFLEHLCFKGTSTMSGKEIMRYLDGLGAETNAFTSQELTGYYAKGRAKYWQKLLNVLADVYINSNFPKEELEKERGVILGEIDMKEDAPLRRIGVDFMRLLYGDQPAGRPVLGPKSIIKKLTRKNFIDYHKKHYVAKKTVVVVAGGVKKGEVKKAVTKVFAHIPTSRAYRKEKVVEKQSRPQIHVRNKKTDQEHIVIGVRTFPRNHKDTVTASLLAAVLGAGMSSRLFERIREDMGAGYYISAGNSNFTDHGFLSVRTGTAPGRTVEVVAAIIDEMQRFTAELVPDAELRKVKEYIIGNTVMGLESSDAWADYYGFQQVLYGELVPLKTRIQEIKSVTPKDIQRVAKKIFINRHLNAAFIGPARKTKALQGALRFPD